VPDDAAPEFGELLRRCRTLVGLTQAQLAERAGISARAVSDLERGGGRAPRLQTVTLLAAALQLTPEQLAQLRTAARPTTTAVDLARQGAHPPPFLPTPATPLLGREAEVAVAAAMLAGDEVRLLTLTGPGGVGKTRLALRVAAELRDAFPDGVHFVSLAPLTDPALVVTAVARGLALAEAGGEPLTTRLIAWLRDRRLLLVLDNCEHVLEAMGLASALLVACPRLAVLATSRAPLRLDGEHEYPVQPLALPAPGKRLSPSQVLSYPATALFVSRARAVAPDRLLSDADVPVIAEICRGLDGLPLAIELAAARARLLAPVAILARLERPLALLTCGPRDAPARQRTLRDTLDWSYALLTPAEQALFARLAVFAGGAALEAIQVVCGDAAGGPSDVLGVIDGLVRASLLHRQEDGAGAGRFGMLETIREYAQERLAASGDSPAMRQRQAAYFLALAEQPEPAMAGGPDQHVWLARLEAEHDNLRAALQWFLERGELESQLRLAGALFHFWHAHAHFGEGRRWLEAGLEQIEEVSVPVRMKALNAAAGLAMIQSDQPRAVALAEELLALSRAHHDSLQTILALSILGMTAIQRGDSHQAAQYLEERLSIARARGRRFDLALSLYDLVLVKSEEGISLEALKLIAEALPLFRDAGETFCAMNAVGSLGFIALLEGRRRQARALLVDYLEMAVRFQDKASIAAGLEGLAAAAIEERRAEHAARLFAVAECLRLEIGGRLMSLRNRTLIERAVSSSREQLGEGAWLAAWKAGQALTMEQAVTMALAIDANPATAMRVVHARAG